MLRRFNPEGVAPPLSNYSHGVVIPAGMKQLHVSGQIGITPDGTIPDDVGEQARWCFANILAILAAEGMAADNLASLTTYVVGEDNLAAVREARQQALGEAAPASTLVFVAALATPVLKVEVQAIAASVV
ncbi:MAG: RidA family protein [bacterium]|nr:RidA family protein [bacterium]MDE0417445.1 RidA family protein [bacterium]